MAKRGRDSGVALAFGVALEQGRYAPECAEAVCICLRQSTYMSFYIQLKTHDMVLCLAHAIGLRLWSNARDQSGRRSV